MDGFHPKIQEAQPSLSTNDYDKLQRERSHLTDLKTFIPEEVWTMVFGKIRNNITIENCSNASPFFWKLLAKKREASVVLPKVFLHLMNHFKNEEIKVLRNQGDDKDENDSDDDEDENDSNEDEDDNDSDDDEDDNDSNEDKDDNDSDDDEDDNDSHDEKDNDSHDEKDNDSANDWMVSKPEPKKDWIGDYNEDISYDIDSLYQIKFCMLKYREVCKSWNRAIEDLYQNEVAGHFALSADFEAIVNRFYTGRVYEFQPQGQIQDFLNHFDLTHYNHEDKKPKKNPFLARQVKFSGLDTWNPIRQHNGQVDNITPLLKRYGSEIWYLDIEFNDNYIEQLYLQLRKFLELMPNLKVLRILVYGYSGDSEDVPIDYLISLYPLPEIPNLKVLNSIKLPSQIFNELVKKGRNICQYQVGRNIVQGNYNIFSTNPSNLTAVNLQFCSIEHFEQFKNCEKLINIKRFYFFYSVWDFLPWSRIFRALEKNLGENCQEIMLQMPIPESDENMKNVLMDSHSFRLNLPKLQKIILYDDAAFCLDFLLPCQNSLQMISLRYSHYKMQSGATDHFKIQQNTFTKFDNPSRVQFIGYKEKLEESNIWKAFPNLTNITLHEIRGGKGVFNCLYNLKSSLTIQRYIVLVR